MRILVIFLSSLATSALDSKLPNLAPEMICLGRVRQSPLNDLLRDLFPQNIVARMSDGYLRFATT